MPILQTTTDATLAEWIDGIVIEGALTTARPVGTMVRNSIDGALYVSTNAAVATYSTVKNSAPTYVGTSTTDTLVGSVIGANVITAFAQGYFVPPNTLRAGSIIKIKGSVRVPSAVALTTVAVSLGVDGAHTLIPAAAVAVDDGAIFDVELHIKSTTIAETNGWASALAAQRTGNLVQQSEQFAVDTTLGVQLGAYASISVADTTSVTLTTFTVDVIY